MRTLLTVGAVGALLAGCAMNSPTPEQQAMALYQQFEPQCRGLDGDQWYWCMKSQHLAYQEAENRRLATATALLGYGSTMMQAAQPYAVAPRPMTCTSSNLGNGYTSTNCF